MSHVRFIDHASCFTLYGYGQWGLEASVQRMSEKGLDFDQLRGKGVAMVEAAHQQAAQMEVAATDEIEKLSETRQKGFGWWGYDGIDGIYDIIFGVNAW